ncbi:hypothetical protein B0H14DRAFT_2783579 [Mycena olivaceomarginata]|nr:hypothetical protein B0H14DRAFT_2783579 [Mycena olivaceomarginata]
MLAFCLFLFRSIYSRPTRRATAPHPIRCVSPSCLRESCLNACGTLLETVTSRCCWCTTVVCRCGVGGTHAATSAPLRVPCTWGSGLLWRLHHCTTAGGCAVRASVTPKRWRMWQHRIGATSSAGERLLSGFTTGVLCVVVGHGGVAPAQKWQCQRRRASPQSPHLGVMAEMREAWRTWMRW